MDEIKINDGGGLYDNVGMVDSLIVDCDNAVRELVGGNYIHFCNCMVNMVKKLTSLKNGIRKDIESREKIIEELRALAEGKGKDGD